MRNRRNPRHDLDVMRQVSRLILLLTPVLVGRGQPNAPTIPPARIQEAIERGRQYKSSYDYLKNGLKAKKVAVAAYENVSFFNDLQLIALQSAEASFQMRELRPEDVRADGLLHAYIGLRLTLPFLGVNWTDVGAADSVMRGSNLVLIIGGKATQPVHRRVIGNHGSTVFDVRFRRLSRRPFRAGHRNLNRRRRRAETPKGKCQSERRPRYALNVESPGPRKSRGCRKAAAKRRHRLMQLRKLAAVIQPTRGMREPEHYKIRPCSLPKVAPSISIKSDSMIR